MCVSCYEWSSLHCDKKPTREQWPTELNLTENQCRIGAPVSLKMKPHTHISPVSTDNSHTCIFLHSHHYTLSGRLSAIYPNAHLHTDLQSQHTASAPALWVFTSQMEGTALGHLGGTAEPDCSVGSPPPWTKWILSRCT